MVASELANSIERKMHKGSCSAVPFFMHVIESGSRATLRLHLPVCDYGAECK
jgi:hypothetical protein